MAEKLVPLASISFRSATDREECVRSASCTPIDTRRPGSGYGRGLRSTALTTLNTVVFAPMPSASDATATKVKPGDRRRSRSAYRTSWRPSSSQRSRVSSRPASFIRSAPPKAIIAARRASSGAMPWRRFFSVCISTWKRISSSISASSVRRRRDPERRARVSLSEAMSCLGCANGYEIDGLREPRPRALLDRELLPAGGSERVVPGASPVLGHPPLGGDPPLALQAVQRGVQGALIHEQHIAGPLLDALGDSPPVHRRELQRLEHQHVERPLQEIALRLVPHHTLLSVAERKGGKIALDCQEEGRRGWLGAGPQPQADPQAASRFALAERTVRTTLTATKPSAPSTIARTTSCCRRSPVMVANPAPGPVRPDRRPTR